MCMADILIIHPSVTCKGGGVAVCMNVLEALQRDHQLTVFSLEHDHIKRLNDYYNTNVTNVSFKSIKYHDKISQLGKVAKLRKSLINRYLAETNVLSSYDLIFSTHNDIFSDTKTINYINDLSFSWKHNSTNRSGLKKLYYSVCKGILPSDNYNNSIYLANSNWTAQKTNIRFPCETIYPPVDTSNINLVDWNEKEDSFVTIGRVTPEKNILRNINIINEVVSMGNNIEYHIVGPTGDSTYSEDVREYVSNYDHIHLEGKVDRHRLIQIIQSNKYGLHGRDSEPFGIAVAELVAGGMIPFIPNGGGQVEIVRGCNNILYDTVDEASRKIDQVLGNVNIQQDIQSKLPNVTNKFGKERFKDDIQNVVDELL